MMGTRGAITALLRLEGGYCGVVYVLYGLFVGLIGCQTAQVYWGRLPKVGGNRRMASMDVTVVLKRGNSCAQIQLDIHLRNITCIAE